MVSGSNLRDYDYTIHDGKGIRKVKDGVEYPISVEDWQRENPKHRDIGCTDCSFVQDKETLLLFIVPRELREEATERPSFIGMFTMPDWVGHSAFYLFRCECCNAVRVDYPHGYTNEGRIYLRCDLCSEKLVLHPRKDRDIYTRNNIHIPVQPSRKEKREMAKLLKARQKELETIESMGVVPVVLPSDGQPRTLKQRLLSLFR